MAYLLLGLLLLYLIYEIYVLVLVAKPKPINLDKRSTSTRQNTRKHDINIDTATEHTKLTGNALFSLLSFFPILL